MDNNGLTTGDLALLKDDNNSMGGLNGLIYLAIIAMMFGGGFGFGNNRGPVQTDNYVTPTQLQEGLNNSQTQNMLTQILQSSANNNYETAQLINNQSQVLMEMRNTDQLAFMQAIQQLQMQSAGNNAQILAAINDVNNQVKTCCCEVKTQMLTDRLADAQADKVTLQNALDNAQQTQNILGSLGRYVAWAGSGTSGGTTTTT
jgi:hypothetical protein